MKAKTKLIATLMAVCLVVTLGVFGIFAVKTLNMSVGGNITFTADGISFEVSKGEFKTTGGAEYTGITSQTGKMQGFAMNTNTKLADVQDKINSWSGLDLVATESLGDPVLHFSITNKMADEILSFDQSVTLGTNINDNMEIIIEPAVANIQALQTQNFTITFRVKDPSINAGLTGANYSGFAIDILLSTAVVATSTTYNNMTFIPIEEGSTSYGILDGTLATGDVVIPTFVEQGGIKCPVVAIAIEAFAGNTNVTSIKLPNTIEIIAESAFAYCENLARITLPNSVKTIYPSVFMSCKSLTSIIIPESVEIIDYGVFGACSGLTSVTIPDSVVSIGDYAFAYCENLTSVTIGENVASVGDFAFAYCSKLTSLTLPDSVVMAGERAFAYCPKLENIIIGAGIQRFGVYVFSECAMLASVTIKATTPPTLGTNPFRASENCIVYVPANSVATYKSATAWSEYANRIQPISA